MRKETNIAHVELLRILTRLLDGSGCSSCRDKLHSLAAQRGSCPTATVSVHTLCQNTVTAVFSGISRHFRWDSLPPVPSVHSGGDSVSANPLGVHVQPGEEAAPCF